MKRLMIYAATAITLMGCSNDPGCDWDRSQKPDVDLGSEDIQIEALLADVQPVTRTSIDGTGKASWINGDALGLFCPQAKAPAVNVSYTVSGLPASPVWAPATGIYWADGATSHTFLAYAPYASGNTSAASVKLPALTPQTGTVNPAQDFLISNNYGTTGIVRPASGNGNVGLIFTHAFALVQLQFTINASVASGTTLQSCVLAGGASDKLYTSDGNSTISLSTGAITAAGTTTNTLTVSPTTPPALSSTATSLFFVILPGTFAPTVQITLSEGGSTITVPTGSLTSTTYNAGSKYMYTVSISRTAISLSNPTITDWNAVSSGSINGGI